MLIAKFLIIFLFQDQTSWITENNITYGITYSRPANLIITYPNQLFKINNFSTKQVLSFNNNIRLDEYLSIDDYVGSLFLYDTLVSLEKCPLLFERINESNIDSVISERNMEVYKPQKKSDFSFETKSVKIGGRDGLMFFYSDPGFIEGGPITEKTYYIQWNNKIVSLCITMLTSNNSTVFIKEFDKIIQSIEFSN